MSRTPLSKASRKKALNKALDAAFKQRLEDLCNEQQALAAWLHTSTSGKSLGKLLASCSDADKWLEKLNAVCVCGSRELYKKLDREYLEYATPPVFYSCGTGDYPSARHTVEQFEELDLFRIGGQAKLRELVNKNGTIRFPEPTARPHPYRGSLILTTLTQYKRVEKHRKTVNALLEDILSFRTQVYGYLAACKTREQAIEKWPAGEPFLPEPIKAAALPIPTTEGMDAILKKAGSKS